MVSIRRVLPATIWGELRRIIDIYPLKAGGKRTVMHRTKTLDYVVVIEGELVLVLDDSEVTLRRSDVVVQSCSASCQSLSR